MNVFIKFIIEALRLLGFNLELETCACCGEKISDKIFPFSYDYNGMLCPKCSNKNEFLELTLGEFAILSKINQADIGSLSTLKFLSRNDLVSVIGLLIKIFRLLTDEEIETIKQFL
jgi:recombinational DNA repair protein (RecF pathway)